MTEEDLKLVLSWRNRPEVRNNMYTSHIISWQEHTSWFARIQNDQTAKYFIYLAGDKPAGVIYFTNIRILSKNAFWGFYAGDNAPLGTGVNMEYEALSYAFDKMDLHKLNCEVIGSNTSVINMHRKVGFKIEGEFRDFHHDGSYFHNVVRLGMLQDEWRMEHKIKLETRLANIGPHH